MAREITLVIPGEAKAFARAGRGGGFTFTPKPQRDYMAVVKHEAWIAMAGESAWLGPISIELEVDYLVPPSWSKKRRASAFWKTSAPDIDNSLKIVKDSLNKIVYRDDAQVCLILAIKKYGPVAQSTIIIKEL